MPGFDLEQDPGLRLPERTESPRMDLPKAREFEDRFDPREGMSGMQRLGLSLEGFGAGFHGRPSMFTRLRAQKIEEEELGLRKKRAEMEAFKATYGMFDEAFKVLRKIPTDKRGAAIGNLAKQMDTVSPGAGEAFRSYAQFSDPDLETAMMLLFKDPDTVKALMKVTGGDEERFFKLIQNKEVVQNIYDQVDRANLPAAHQKLSAIGKIPPDKVPESIRSRIKKDPEGNTFLDLGLLREFNKTLPYEQQLTEGELRTIERKPDQFAALGLVPPDVSKKVLEKNLTKERWGEPYSLSGKTVQKNLDTGQIREVGGGGTNVNVKVDQREQQTFGNEEKLRGEFETGSKKFVVMRNYFVPVVRHRESLKGKEPSSAVDLQLAYAYAQALDPKDTRITEGDFLRLQKLGSIPERIGTAIASVIQGYNLPDDVRDEMYGIASRSFKEMNRTQREHEERYVKLTTEYPDLSPGRVVKQYSLNPKGGKGINLGKPSKAGEDVPPLDQILEEAKSNNWDSATTERTIREMHGEAGVRQWRERRSDRRKEGKEK